MAGKFNFFTLKSDQFKISPAWWRLIEVKSIINKFVNFFNSSQIHWTPQVHDRSVWWKREFPASGRIHRTVQIHQTTEFIEQPNSSKNRISPMKRAFWLADEPRYILPPTTTSIAWSTDVCLFTLPSAGFGAEKRRPTLATLLITGLYGPKDYWAFLDTDQGSGVGE